MFVDKDTERYPDFAITVYGNLISREAARVDDINPEDVDEHRKRVIRYDDQGDIIRLVIEVGSLGPDPDFPMRHKKEAMIDQLQQYLEFMGEHGLRWEGKAYGLAILGLEYFVIGCNKDGTYDYGTEWKSMFDDAFIKFLEDVAEIE